MKSFHHLYWQSLFSSILIMVFTILEYFFWGGSFSKVFWTFISFQVLIVWYVFKRWYTSSERALDILYVFAFYRLLVVNLQYRDMVPEILQEPNKTLLKENPLWVLFVVNYLNDKSLLKNVFILVPIFLVGYYFICSYEATIAYDQWTGVKIDT